VGVGVAEGSGNRTHHGP